MVGVRLGAIRIAMHDLQNHRARGKRSRNEKESDTEGAHRPLGYWSLNAALHLVHVEFGKVLGIKENLVEIDLPSIRVAPSW